MVSLPHSRWDFSVVDHNNQLVLVVEVKRKTNASPDWAAKFRRNLLAHGILPRAPYFLLAFPDLFYLWNEVDSHLELNQLSQPTYSIDAQPILQPYFERAGVTADTISAQSLELVIASWLSEIMHTGQVPYGVDTSQHWIVDSGLQDALSGGRFEPEAAA